MIGTILQVSWLNLRRDRVALPLTFLLPIALFSVFALVFGGIDGAGQRTAEAALVVEDSSGSAIRLREILRESRGLEWVTADVAGDPLTRAQAIDLLRDGRVDVAIVIAEAFDPNSSAVHRGATEVVLYINAANPLAEPVTEGVLRAAALELAFEAMPRLSGIGGGVLQPGALMRVRVENTLEGAGKKPSVAFFAAGIGVMFLLFAVSGRSAILIEERESGVLTRLLSSRLTMTQLLFGRWLFLLLVGSSQVTIMFVWASLAFGLDLWTPRHLAGFLLMTVASAAAAAAFGLLLATVCRSRAQLNGVASVVILVMSALGGSMFPRFLMPEALEKLGSLTFNAWALDGYQKVFWYEAGVGQLVPQIGVLALATVLFGGMARLFAQRWSAL